MIFARRVATNSSSTGLMMHTPSFQQLIVRRSSGRQECPICERGKLRQTYSRSCFTAPHQISKPTSFEWTGTRGSQFSAIELPGACRAGRTDLRCELKIWRVWKGQSFRHWSNSGKLAGAA